MHTHVYKHGASTHSGRCRLQQAHRYMYCCLTGASSLWGSRAQVCVRDFYLYLCDNKHAMNTRVMNRRAAGAHLTSHRHAGGCKSNTVDTEGVILLQRLMGIKTQHGSEQTLELLDPFLPAEVCFLIISCKYILTIFRCCNIVVFTVRSLVDFDHARLCQMISNSL